MQGRAHIAYDSMSAVPVAHEWRHEGRSACMATWSKNRGQEQRLKEIPEHDITKSERGSRDLARGAL